MLQPLAQKKLVIILAILSFLFITWLIFYTSQENMLGTWPEFVVKILLYPFQKAIHYVSSFLSATWETLNNLAALNRENYELRREIVDLKLRLSRLEPLARENDQLREALQFKTSSPLQLLPAEVIARNPVYRLDTVIIDKGKNHGLARNMPVITKEGVVGRLLTVSPTFAEVVLLTDPREGNSMSGVIERTRELVYIFGGTRRGYCLVKPSDLGVRLEVGDRILTSGSSLYFPKNLVVGVIQEVYDRGEGFKQEGLLKPAVNFSRLEYVFVVKDIKQRPERGE